MILKRCTSRKALILAFFPLFLLGGNGEAGDFKAERHSMVETQIAARGIKSPRLLKVMREVQRHLFVPKNYLYSAYADNPLPIGEGQTISQPYIVALMTDLLNLKGDEKVLEIGTGSGYQAAVLSKMCKEVYTIEIKKLLHQRSTAGFKKLGYKNVKTLYGDGYFGWKEKGPFDSIMITAAADHIPPPLIAQLKEGGKIILPLKTSWLFQTLTIGTKKKNEISIRHITSVRFVPMTGKMLE